MTRFRRGGQAALSGSENSSTEITKASITSGVIHGIIIGGGIGGMALAAALERAGVTYEVHEQADELGEVGAGLTLWRRRASNK